MFFKTNKPHIPFFISRIVLYNTNHAYNVPYQIGKSILSTYCLSTIFEYDFLIFNLQNYIMYKINTTSVAWVVARNGIMIIM